VSEDASRIKAEYRSRGNALFLAGDFRITAAWGDVDFLTTTTTTTTTAPQPLIPTHLVLNGAADAAPGRRVWAAHCFGSLSGALQQSSLPPSTLARTTRRQPDPATRTGFCSRLMRFRVLARTHPRRRNPGYFGLPNATPRSTLLAQKLRATVTAARRERRVYLGILTAQ